MHGIPPSLSTTAHQENRAGRRRRPKMVEVAQRLAAMRERDIFPVLTEAPSGGCCVVS